MITCRQAAVLVGAFCMFAAEATAETPELVGELGKPERLVIEGTTTFAPEEVRRAFLANLWFTPKALAKEPLSNYVELLQKDVTKGYRYAGFPDAKVTVEVERAASRVVARVEEGPVFKTGDVRIEGARTIPTEMLVRRVTSPCAPEPYYDRSLMEVRSGSGFKWINRDGKDIDLRKPCWRSAQRAGLDQATKHNLESQIKRALCDLGYFDARFTLLVDPDRDRGVAHLVIRIDEEGERTAIEEIEVKGNHKNSREAIIGFLGARVGEPLTQRDLTHMEHQLWQSGRFTECSVYRTYRATYGPGLREHWGLGIKVAEYEKAAPLDKPDAREEQAILALRQWLLHPEKWGCDLVLSTETKKDRYEAVISPGRGCLLQYVKRPKPGRQATPQFTAAVSRGKIIAYSAALRKRFVAPVSTKAEPTADVSLKFTDNPKRRFSLRVGAGFRSLGDDETPRPFFPDMDLEPPAFLGQLYEHRAKATVEDGVLSVVSKKVRIRVEADSGRLIEWAVLSKGRDEFRMYSEKDALKRRLREAVHAGKRLPNAYDPASPKESLSKFLAAFDREDASAAQDILMSFTRMILSDALSGAWEGFEQFETVKGSRRFVIP
jgi:hypothetical protein